MPGTANDLILALVVFGDGATALVELDVSADRPGDPFNRDKGGRFSKRELRVGGFDSKWTERAAALVNQWVSENPEGEVIPGQPDTMQAYRPAEVWDGERVELHRAVLERKLSEAKPVEDPKTIFTAGGAAAGKSSINDVVRFDDPNNVVGVDADVMKRELPEGPLLYGLKREDAGSRLHEQSSYLSKALGASCLATSRNAIVDSTGSSVTWLDRVQAAADSESGEDTEIVYATCPVDVAIERAHVRFEDEGRLTPDTYVRDSHAKASQMFPRAVATGVKVHVYDTTTKPPELIATADKGKVSVVKGQEEKYADFIDKGRAPRAPQILEWLERQFEPDKTLHYEGEAFEAPEPGSYPEQYEMDRGPMKQCYANAGRMAMAHPELTYVEGYAMVPGIPMPIQHAWCVDRYGNVIDPTWDPPGTEYLGKSMTMPELAAESVRSGTWGPFVGRKR